MGLNKQVTVKLPPVAAGVTGRKLRIGNPMGVFKEFDLGADDLEIEIVFAKGRDYSLDLCDCNAAGCSSWSDKVTVSIPADPAPVPAEIPNAPSPAATPLPPEKPSPPSVDMATATDTDDPADVE